MKFSSFIKYNVSRIFFRLIETKKNTQIKHTVPKRNKQKI